MIDLRDSTPIKTCTECSARGLYDCVVIEEGGGEHQFKEYLCKECLQTAVEFDFLIKAARLV